MKAKLFMCPQCMVHSQTDRCNICGGVARLQEVEVTVVEPTGKIHGDSCRCMVCPKCGAAEVDDCRKPVQGWVWNIEPFAAGDMSHCKLCGEWF